MDARSSSIRHTATWTGGDFYGEGVGGVLRIRGTFDAQTIDDMPQSAGYDDRHHRAGRGLQKTAGTAGELTYVNNPFVNNGTVLAQTRTLDAA